MQCLIVFVAFILVYWWFAEVLTKFSSRYSKNIEMYIDVYKSKFLQVFLLFIYLFFYFIDISKKAKNTNKLTIRITTTIQ